MKLENLRVHMSLRVSQLEQAAINLSGDVDMLQGRGFECNHRRDIRSVIIGLESLLKRHEKSNEAA